MKGIKPIFVVFPNENTKSNNENLENNGEILQMGENCWAHIK